jgi:hypothetical protein
MDDEKMILSSSIQIAHDPRSSGGVSGIGGVRRAKSYIQMRRLAPA